MSEIRFGVIGAGNTDVGTSRGNSFIRVLKLFEGTRVTAVFDIKPDNAERGAALAEGARAFTSLEPFLDSGLDAAIICSPVRFHAEQAVACLDRGLHVLSEVTAAHSLEAARALAEAAGRSRAKYMLGENYRYLDEIELVKRMVEEGRFGEPYYAEGEYLHDCKDLWFDKQGNLTWRGEGRETLGYGVYCTHSLGPVLYLLEDRVTQVTSLASPISLIAPERRGSFNYTLLMKTAGGRTVKVRVDTVSPRPHQMAYYSLQGNKGCYESWRGLGDSPKVWLADEHEPSHVHGSAKWHPLWDYAKRYIPDRLEVGEAAKSGGHGTSEYWMLKDFLAAIREDKPTPIDAYRALDYTVPGICAMESAARGGAVVAVPDFRPQQQ